MSLELDPRLNDGRDDGQAAESLRGNGGGLGIRVAVTDNVTLAFAYDTEDQSDETVTEEPALFNDTALRGDDGNVVDGYALGDGKGPEIDRIGVSANVSAGQFWGALSWSTMETTDDVADVRLNEEGTPVVFPEGTIPGAVETETDGEDAKPSRVTLDLYHNLGGGLRLWYEGKSHDPDVDGEDRESQHFVGIRYDF